MVATLSAAALLFAAQAAIGVTPGFIRLQPLGTDGPHCLADKSLCLRIVHGEERAEFPPELQLIRPATAAGSDTVSAIPLPFAPGEREWLTLWPQLLMLPGTAAAPEGRPEALLIGVLTSYSTMYSGGGGEATRLHLFEVSRAYGSPRLAGERLAIPYTSSLMIRACFSEHDFKDRHGACHDEYRFSAELGLTAGPTGSSMPQLTYRTSAETFPRSASRSADGSGVRLTRADLVWQADPECSYSRQLRFNPASERYEMDRPAPDCSEFTAP